MPPPSNFVTSQIYYSSSEEEEESEDDSFEKLTLHELESEQKMSAEEERQREGTNGWRDRNHKLQITNKTEDNDDFSDSDSDDSFTIEEEFDTSRW